MAYVVQDPTFPPAQEPVSLQDLKDWVGVADTNSDAMLTALIRAAREYCEGFCQRSFVAKGYIQTLDSYPYFIDTIMSQQAYPPSYYAAPRYSTTLWNYSQMIKLTYGPLLDVETLRYVAAADGAWHVLTGTTDMSNTTADFLADTSTMPPRLFPRAGNFWPAVMYVPNSVEIHYTAGPGGPAPGAPVLGAQAGGSLAARTYSVRLTYILGNQESTASRPANIAIAANNLLQVVSPDPNFLAVGYNVYASAVPGQETLQNSAPIAIGTNWIEPTTGHTSTGPAVPSAGNFVPESVKVAIKMLAATWFENREAVSPLQMREVPRGVESLLWMNKVMDVAPTRG